MKDSDFFFLQLFFFLYLFYIDVSHKRAIFCYHWGLVITANFTWWWGSNSSDMVSVEFSFIAITPNSTQTQSSDTF